jgi:hypothetical protein
MHLLFGKESTPTITLALATARFALPAAAATGLLFYLLSWLKQLHAEDVRSERDLERYSYDIDRASWVIETILEAETKEGDVPSEWISGVTHALFTRTDARTEESSAADGLASLFNVAAKAEFGPSGPRFEISRPGLRKIGKSMEQTSEA